MTKRMTIMLIAVGLVFGGVFGFQFFMKTMIKKFMTAMPQPPQTVSTVMAAMQEWQPQVEAVGVPRRDDRDRRRTIGGEPRAVPADLAQPHAFDGHDAAVQRHRGHER